MTATTIIYAHATREEAEQAAFNAGYRKNHLDWDDEWNAYRPTLERLYQAGRQAAQGSKRVTAQ
ncbi:hypothetical protein LX59_00833 [Azomonas agilis]|uniref:Uncharacterized protein n=1 Tax=Azomonas agilis TaxID=116849 RepID=A0A562J0R8_9GAMM|nr:hypothetical protein [Azomonas agilis]TWH76788.1 hypothetical protein LX59_00833 [Azomonas agilis]